MKNNKKTLIKGIILLMFVAIIGTTYAYFAANITGNESTSTIVVTGGTMEIVYDNLSGTIEAFDIYPKNDAWVTKNFTVTGNNSTNKNMKYKLALKVDKNTFSSGTLTYSLTSVNTSNKGTIVESKTNQTISDLSETSFGTGSFPNGEDMVHTYTFELFFKDTGENQNIDQGKQFAGYITIKESPFNEIALKQSNLSSIGYTDNTVPSSLVIPEKYKVGDEYNQVTSIANSAFQGNNTLTSLTLNEGLESIGDDAFYNATNLTGNLTIPSTVKTIGGGAFYNTSINSLTLNEGLENINSHAFNTTPNLIENIIIPSTVKTIGVRAFNESGISGLVLNEGIESIGEYSFRECRSLTGNLTIPSTVKTIDKGAFYRVGKNSGITTIILNEGLESIGEHAFSEVPILSGSITIPKTVKEIKAEAFWATGVKTINYRGTQDQWNQVSKVSSSFPSGVTINYNYTGA